MASRKLIAFSGILLLIVLGWILQSIISPQRIVVVTQSGFTDMEQRSFELFQEANRLLISLALLVFAGVGVFIQLLVTGEVNTRLVAMDRWPLILSLVLAASSLYFGHLTGENMSFLLRHGAYDPTIPLISIPKDLQFYCFLGAVCSFGIFIFEALYPRKKS